MRRSVARRWCVAQGSRPGGAAVSSTEHPAGAERLPVSPHGAGETWPPAGVRAGTRRTTVIGRHLAMLLADAAKPDIVVAVRHVVVVARGRAHVVGVGVVPSAAAERTGEAGASGTLRLVLARRPVDRRVEDEPEVGGEGDVVVDNIAALSTRAAVATWRRGRRATRRGRRGRGRARRRRCGRRPACRRGGAARRARRA